MIPRLPKREKAEAKHLIGYVPHGVNPKVFRPFDALTDIPEMEALANYKTSLFGDRAAEVKFTVLYNNRNIGRKMPGNVLLAFNHFVQGLPEKDRNSVRLIMHTHPVDENGTHLPIVIEEVVPQVKHLIVFSVQKLAPNDMGVIYNAADVVINLASNEGFGISTLEGIMSGRMIVANVTGGLQDQMGFMDNNGTLLHEDTHYTGTWGSNHDGKYQFNGPWAIPVFPSNLSLIGSVPTPYIFDDRCNYTDAGKALRVVYDMPTNVRVQNGILGRKFAFKNAMTTHAMCARMIHGIDSTLASWKPPAKFALYKSEDMK